jgi:hypothetical protein
MRRDQKGHTLAKRGSFLALVGKVYCWCTILATDGSPGCASTSTLAVTTYCWRTSLALPTQIAQHPLRGSNSAMTSSAMFLTIVRKPIYAMASRTPGLSLDLLYTLAYARQDLVMLLFPSLFGVFCPTGTTTK